MGPRDKNFLDIWTPVVPNKWRNEIKSPICLGTLDVQVASTILESERRPWGLPLE